MAKKYLDLEGLKVVWGKVKAENNKIQTNIQGTIDGISGDLDTLKKQVDNKVDSSKVGVANGVAPLNERGLIPSSLLPSFVDDVVEFSSFSKFPTKGETGKIYVAMDTNKTYRWGGTAYVEISASLALGLEEGMAYPGNLGAQNAKDIKVLQDIIGTDLIGNEVDNYIVVNPNAGSYSYGISLNPQKIATSTELPEQEELVTTGYVQERLGTINGSITSINNKFGNYYTKTQTDTAISNAKTAVENKIVGGAGEAYNTLKKLQTVTEGKLDAADGNGTDLAYSIGNDTGLTGGTTDKLEILKTTSSRGLFSGLSLTNGSIVLVAGHQVGDLTDCVGLMIDQSTLSIKKFQDITTPDEYVELLDESMALSESELNAILV